mgnify:FL=1
MGWKERTVKQMREEFVRRVLAKEKSKAALCREYGISRPTGDKWLRRYQENAPLSDRSRAPKTQPRRIAPEVEASIVQLRRQYPALGAEKLHKMMENMGCENLPCARTFNNIFARNHLISKEASLAAKHIQRFEKEQPNVMWQTDFKGHFALASGVRCHPLNILDDHSRFCLCTEALENETFLAVKPVFERVFSEFGLPFSLLCDNGNPWGTSQSTGYTAFEVWLMELGVLTLHGRPLHPQTQGKQERFNRSFTRECLAGKTFRDLADAQKAFDDYRAFYNTVRPHSALELAVPASVYSTSPRPFPSHIEDWEYGNNCQLCKVRQNGYFSFEGQGYFLSEAFRGKTIAVRESHLPGQITLLFRQFRIGRIDREKRVFTTKRISRLAGDPRENV